MVGRYLYNILYSIDQLGNTICGGDPDESISSSLGKRAREGKLRGWPKFLSNALSKIEPDHCINAIEADEGSRALRNVAIRCDKAIVDSGIVVRCRLAAGHPGQHRGHRGRLGHRVWVGW
jgi:hypothetical protein